MPVIVSAGAPEASPIIFVGGTSLFWGALPARGQRECHTERECHTSVPRGTR
jgi:hypothetical protein